MFAILRQKSYVVFLLQNETRTKTVCLGAAAFDFVMFVHYNKRFIDNMGADAFDFADCNPDLLDNLEAAAHKHLLDNMGSAAFDYATAFDFADYNRRLLDNIETMLKGQ